MSFAFLRRAARVPAHLERELFSKITFVACRIEIRMEGETKSVFAFIRIGKRRNVQVNEVELSRNDITRRLIICRSGLNNCTVTGARELLGLIKLALCTIFLFCPRARSVDRRSSEAEPIWGQSGFDTSLLHIHFARPLMIAYGVANNLIRCILSDF